MIPIIQQGHFVHPDIWMLWFSFFVSAAVTGSWLFRIILRLLDWQYRSWNSGRDVR